MKKKLKTKVKTKVKTKEKKTKKTYKVKFKKVNGEELATEELAKNLRTGKCIGYCPTCLKAVADFDIIDKTKYNCLGCGEEGKIKKLKSEVPFVPKWGSKRDYLNNTVFDKALLAPLVDIEPEAD